jgi:hypothetical protein
MCVWSGWWRRGRFSNIDLPCRHELIIVIVFWE